MHNNNGRNGSFYVAGYLIEERRRWPVDTASPRGQCSKLGVKGVRCTILGDKGVRCKMLGVKGVRCKRKQDNHRLQTLVATIQF